MDKSYTLIKFCFEVYPFEANAYSFQVNSSTLVRCIEMTGNSNLNDVGLFIGSLLAFSGLSFDSEFIDALFKKGELALVGGLLFEQSNLAISPSCCADFQDWIEVVKDIKRGTSPWMGHDPSPWFDFEDENIILWSDEEKVENIYHIQITQQEFDEQLLRAKQELRCFLKKIRVWASKNHKNNSDRLIDGIEHYLFIENDI